MRSEYVYLCIIGWGLSVVFASVAGRTLSTPGVIVAEACGGALLLALWIQRLAPADRVPQCGHAWAVLAGLTGVLGTFGFYRVIATAELSRMVPLTSLYVVLPLVFGAAVLRERLTAAQWLGVLLALVAGYLLASGPPAPAGSGGPS